MDRKKWNMGMEHSQRADTSQEGSTGPLSGVAVLYRRTLCFIMVRPVVNPTTGVGCEYLKCTCAL